MTAWRRGFQLLTLSPPSSSARRPGTTSYGEVTMAGTRTAERKDDAIVAERQAGWGLGLGVG